MLFTISFGFPYERTRWKSCALDIYVFINYYTSIGGLFLSDGIMRPVVTWFIGYI